MKAHILLAQVVHTHEDGSVSMLQALSLKRDFWIRRNEGVSSTSVP
jgi:hypothetical protein